MSMYASWTFIRQYLYVTVICFYLVRRTVSENLFRDRHFDGWECCFCVCGFVNDEHRVQEERSLITFGVSRPFVKLFSCLNCIC